MRTETQTNVTPLPLFTPKTWDAISLVVNLLGVALLISGAVTLGIGGLPFHWSVTLTCVGSLLLLPLFCQALLLASDWIQKQKDVETRIPTHIRPTGVSREETIPLNQPITTIDFRNNGTLRIVAGTENSFTVRADETVIQYLNPVIEGNRLVIPSTNADQDNLSYTLTLINPSVIRNLTARADGSVMIDGFNGPTFNCEILRNARVMASGAVTQQNIRIVGNGTFLGGSFQSQHTTIELSGDGIAIVAADVDLAGHISGSGNCQLSGTAQSQVQTNSTGRVIQAP